MKQSLADLVTERSIKDSHGTLSLLLTVIIKYGMAPIACIYMGYIIIQKDAVIEKRTDSVSALVQKQTDATLAQTAATVKQTTVLESFSKSIDLNNKRMEDLERKIK